MYLALTAPSDGAPSWGSDWIADFDRILSLPSTNPSPSAADEEDDVPHFSLVTGKLVYAEQSRPMRHVQQQQVEYDEGTGVLVKREGGAGGEVAVRADGSVVVRGVRSLAGEKLRSRSWRGLRGGISKLMV